MRTFRYCCLAIYLRIEGAEVDGAAVGVLEMLDLVLIELELDVELPL